jgi:beta-galactosidase/beta-glucuronidase
MFDRTIVVPYPPESPASGIRDETFHPVVWYRREFAGHCAAGRLLVLHFGAVDYRATVWVNGQLVVKHEGGHTPFHADITEVLRAEGDQEVVVRAEDQPHDLEQPRGKQDWQVQPHAIWYRRTTGIWQPVWLEEVSATRIESLRWTPDLERTCVCLDLRVRRVDERPLRLRVGLSLRGDSIPPGRWSAMTAGSRL